MSKPGGWNYTSYAARRYRAIRARTLAELDEDTMRHRHVNSEKCVVCSTLRRVFDPDGIDLPHRGVLEEK